MISKLDIIIWIAFTLLGTFYLYFLGIKRDWQELRIKKGLVKQNVKTPPAMKQKCIFNHEIYRQPCKVFLAISFLISTSIVCIFYIATPGKKMNSFEGIFTTLVSLWFVFSIFTGSPINKEVLPAEENNKFYIKVLTVSSVLKGFIIEKYINYEYELMQKFIKDKITEWYETRYANNNLGALIIRIHSVFFNKMLPEGCDEGIKELLKQESLNILNLYSRDDVTLCDELIRLFETDMIKYGVKIIDLVEFIHNEEALGISVSRSQIEQHLNENLVKGSTGNVKRKSASDIKEILGKVLQDKKAGSKNDTTMGA